MFYFQKNLQKKKNNLRNNLQKNLQKNHSSQQTITCLKLAIEVLEKGEKKVRNKNNRRTSMTSF